MGTNRQIIENRIFEILTYIENDTLAFPLKQNIKLFSLKEINQLLEFLETGNLKHIYILLDQKLKEFKGLIEEFKMIKVGEKKKKKLNEEIKEQEVEKQKIEQLINF